MIGSLGGVQLVTVQPAFHRLQFKCNHWLCPCLSSPNNMGLNLKAKSQKPLQFVIDFKITTRYTSLVVKWVLLRVKNILPRQYTSLETLSTSTPANVLRIPRGYILYMLKCSKFVNLENTYHVQIKHKSALQTY